MAVICADPDTEIVKTLQRVNNILLEKNLLWCWSRELCQENICKILATYADEAVLNEQGKIDYHTFKPVLFEFPTFRLDFLPLTEYNKC